VSEAVVRQSSLPGGRVRLIGTLRAAQSLRREFARSSGHRVALALAALLVGAELLTNGLGQADIVDVLENVAWCAALSVASTLGPTSGRSDFDALARMRGQPGGLHAWASPLARLALAFSLHGTVALLLGVGLVLRGEGTLPALLVASSVTALSFFGALSLSALGWFSTRLLPHSAVAVYFALLVVPSALHSSLFELPSLIDAWSSGIDTCLGWLHK
jgi:hypothetical protein